MIDESGFEYKGYNVVYTDSGLFKIVHNGSRLSGLFSTDSDAMEYIDNIFDIFNLKNINIKKPVNKVIEYKKIPIKKFKLLYKGCKMNVYVLVNVNYKTYLCGNKWLKIIGNNDSLTIFLDKSYAESKLKFYDFAEVENFYWDGFNLKSK